MKSAVKKQKTKMTTLTSKPKSRFAIFAESLLNKVTSFAAVVVSMFLLGFLIMVLWNCLFPSLFGLPCITYWQSVALGVLARILFGFD